MNMLWSCAKVKRGNYKFSQPIASLFLKMDSVAFSGCEGQGVSNPLKKGSSSIFFFGGVHVTLPPFLLYNTAIYGKKIIQPYK
jgi:hypothetical protein